MRLGESTWPQIEKYLETEESPMILVPISPVEEHGPHLPVGTDYLLTEQVTWMVADICGSMVFPTIPLMCCGISRDASGTYPVKENTIKMITGDLLEELVRKGFRRIFFLTTHFGFSTDKMREVIREKLSAENNKDLIIDVIQFNEVVPQQLPGDLIETRGDTHAGEIETSAAMVLIPGMVGNLPPADFHEKIGGKPAILSASGVNGNPRKATHDKGEKIVQAAVHGVLERISAITLKHTELSVESIHP